MKREFPTIAQYNQVIKNQGGNALRTLQGLTFIPSRIMPIKVFLFGSGAYAVVFKGSKENKNYAIRCFLSTEQENIDRYKAICEYLSNINAEWKVDCHFLENEISVHGKYYPLLTMEWIEGVLINQFVSKNLNNNSVLAELQQQLVEISDDLEKKQIGHGDLQCGNIIVQFEQNSFQLKLIDYDGMYIPEFEGAKSLELGRSEFQHPKRKYTDFSFRIDRFSFWVMITALEAIKYDKTLWREVMQGGFNTLDNFLFTIQDFLHPNSSKLFSRLEQINQPSVVFYTEKLKQYCRASSQMVEKPILFSGGIERQVQNELPFTKVAGQNTHEIEVMPDNILITSSPEGATVLTAIFQKIGVTPLQLNKVNYVGKTLIVTYNNDVKRVMIAQNTDVIKVPF
ncbi:hypothetical protein ACIRNY_11800 [Capnocytophaga canimorsus]|uniref:hypothetical protein n=1 Tax=Capnocytophaga canimorsus TaxID=28188 RepID=UPI0038507AA5